MNFRINVQFELIETVYLVAAESDSYKIIKKYPLMGMELSYLH